MCFSAEADFVSGAVIGVIGVVTLTKVEKPRELALGMLPLAFALHQIVEGFVWKSLSDPAPHTGDGVAVYMYVVFAWVVLPILAPLAILLVERDRRRRNAMWIFVALGSLAGVYLLGAVMSNDITAHIAEHTIQYGGAGGYADIATGLYVIATCGAPLLSSYRQIRWFGVANIARGRGHRRRPGRGAHVGVVRVGRGRQRADLRAVRGVAAQRSRAAADGGRLTADPCAGGAERAPRTTPSHVSRLTALDTREFNSKGMVIIGLAVIATVILLAVVPKDGPLGGVRSASTEEATGTTLAPSTTLVPGTTLPGTATTKAPTTTTPATATTKKGSTATTTTTINPATPPGVAAGLERPRRRHPPAEAHRRASSSPAPPTGTSGPRPRPR